MKKIFQSIFILISLGVIVYILVRPSGQIGAIPDISDWETVYDSQDHSILMNPENGEWVFLLPDIEDTIINGPYPGLPPTSDEFELVSYDIIEDSIPVTKFFYIVENTDTANNKCMIRMFDDEGKLVKTYTREGECVCSVRDQENDRKSIISKNGNTAEVFLVDYPEGNNLGTAYIPYDTLETIPDVELVGDKIIVIVQREDSFYVFINFTRQALFQDRFSMPGKFDTAVDNRSNLKFIITEASNGTYGDVFIIQDSITNNHIHSGGAVPGNTDDIQIHKIGNEWRIFHSIYNPLSKSTLLRIYDQEGRIIKQYTLKENINRTTLHPQSNPQRKIFFTDDEDNTQVYIVELQSGDQIIPGGTIPGRYQSHSLQNNQLKVTTRYQGQDFDKIINLP